MKHLSFLLIIFIFLVGPSAAGDIKEAEELTQRMILLYQHGDYAEAARIGEHVLMIRREIHGDDHPETAPSHNNLGLIYMSMGNYVKAESHYKRALEIDEEKLGPEHPVTATNMSNLGNLYRSMGDYKMAEPLLERALAVRKKVQGPDHLDTAVELNNLALLYFAQGKYAQAEPLFQRSLKICKDVLGLNHDRTCTILDNLGQLYQKTGEYEKAEPLLKQALEIGTKGRGPNHPKNAGTLNSLGLLYESMGDYDKANALYKLSLKILQNNHKEDHPYLALALNNLARIYILTGKFTEAEPLLTRALAMAQKTLGPDHPDTAMTLNNLAVLYDKLKRFTKAEGLYRQALEIDEKTLGRNHPNVARDLNNLAFLNQVMGHYDRAEPLYRRALEIKEKVFGQIHPDTTVSLFNLAFMYGAMGRSDDSLSLFKRGLANQNRFIGNVLGIGNERQKLLLVQNLPMGYQGALSLIHKKFVKDPAALRLGLNIVLSRKGVVFDAQAKQREALMGSADPKAKEAWKELSFLRSKLAKLLMAKPEEMSAEDYRSKTVSLQWQIEKLESGLAAISPLVAEEREQRQATVDKIAPILPEGSVLAEFVRIGVFDWDKCKWSGKKLYLVFILHSDRRIELVILGDAEKIDAKVQALMGRISSIPNSLEDVKTQSDSAKELYSLLWEPLSGPVGNAVNVIVSPDGILNLVAFSALLDPADRFLVEDRNITYVTSGRDLLRGKSGFQPESDLFIAANPTFDMQVTLKSIPIQSLKKGFRSAGFALQFSPLPGTSEEAKAIPPLLPGKIKVVVTGKDATESAVLKARRPKTLHLATHGFFLKDQEATPANENLRPSFQSILPRGFENPLVRSGLALARANNASKAKTSNDGLLTALEVSGMDLNGTELVTLSACETGVGEVKAGEGVFGLRRAFALSGARNLMMSLWPVSDAITAEQMKTFYRFYGKGMLPAEALRKAQLETIATLRKRYGAAPASLWAPFILQGPPVSRQKEVEK
ncbi:tetratricopeptide repeat protein [Thermodesulfobacteriota bacterium]